LLAELAQVRSHYVGVAQTVQQRERGRDRTDGKGGRIGRLISLIGDCNVAGPQPSVGDRIGDEIGESETDRADELAHLQSHRVGHFRSALQSAKKSGGGSCSGSVVSQSDAEKGNGA
jgi:hypothetical protein